MECLVIFIVNVSTKCTFKKCLTKQLILGWIKKKSLLKEFNLPHFNVFIRMFYVFFLF